MKLVILAGGLGTRFSEETHSKPKPMIKIFNKPIIWHIMKHYDRYNVKNFIICGGYKWQIIKKFFISRSKKDSIIYHNKKKVGHYFYLKNLNWHIQLINTGKNTMTGGRIKKIGKFLDKDNDSFYLTYGDGISNINISKLLKFHNKMKLLATVSAVRPPARFGSLIIKNNRVIEFNEKNKNFESLINGGFFVLSKKIIKYIKHNSTIFEQYPLKKLAKQKQLASYFHKGVWFPMDTIRDKKIIKNYMKKNTYDFK